MKTSSHSYAKKEFLYSTILKVLIIPSYKKKIIWVFPFHSAEHAGFFFNEGVSCIEKLTLTAAFKKLWIHLDVHMLESAQVFHPWGI